jgi:hypothetical protein
MPLIAREKEYTPSSASKDVTISSDGKHMYWLESFESYSINIFALGARRCGDLQGAIHPGGDEDEG